MIIHKFIKIELKNLKKNPRQDRQIRMDFPLKIKSSIKIV